MKKQTIFVAMTLLAVLASSCSNNKPVTPDKAAYDLIGDVSQVQIDTYYAHEEDGSLIKDRLADQYIVSYNEDGKILSFWREWTSDKDVYSYNDSICRYESYKEGTMYSYREIYYNSWGEDSLIITYSPNGEETRRTVFEYNDLKQVIGKSFFQNGELYDFYDNYAYDKKGNLLQYSVHYANTPAYEMTYYKTYDKNNRRLKESLVSNNPKKPSYQKTYEYNDHGFVSKSIDDESTHCWTINYTYEYDEKGNYIVCQQRAHKLDKETGKEYDAYLIIERKISYFD